MYKYPKTPYLPFSSYVDRKDKIVSLEDSSLVGRNVIASIKYDGENASVSKARVWARSLSSVDHEYRHWVKEFAAKWQYLLGDNERVCGENLYAVHSIKYEKLLSYFYAFSVWDGETCLSWDDSLKKFNQFGLNHVEVFYEGEFNFNKIMSAFQPYKLDNEGFVVRISDSFHYNDFGKCVAKWVRSNHVESPVHWTKLPLRINALDK